MFTIAGNIIHMRGATVHTTDGSPNLIDKRIVDANRNIAVGKRDGEASGTTNDDKRGASRKIDNSKTDASKHKHDRKKANSGKADGDERNSDKSNGNNHGGRTNAIEL